MAGILPLASTAAIVRSRGPGAAGHPRILSDRSEIVTGNATWPGRQRDRRRCARAACIILHPSVKSPQRQVTRRSWDVGVGYVGPHLGHERPHRSGTTTVTSGPSSAQLSNRTRPSVTGRACLLGLSGTEVITPPGLILDARVGCPIERAAGRRFRLWSRRSWQLRLGSRRAATGIRNDRGARLETVEDHDR
jgi:hypothetical protein